MARSYSAREGVAVDGRFVRTAVREFPRPDFEFYADAIRKEMARGYLRWDNAANKHIPTTQKHIDDDLSSFSKTKQVKVVGKEFGSPERIAELDALRAKSAVPFVVYRGQDAYEVLDKKMAADVVRKKNEEIRSYDTKKNLSTKAGGQGSRADGLYHFSPDATYANEYAHGDKRAVVEGVVISRAHLDLNDLSYSSRTWWGKRPEFSAEREKHFGEKVRFDFEAGYDRKEYATALVDKLRSEYRKTFGKELPETAGLRGEERKNGKSDIGTGNYKRLIGEVERDVKKFTVTKKGESGLMTYQLLRLPFFKQFIKDTGFDAISYKDFNGGFTENTNYMDGQKAIALVNPNQFKSYYGDKKVNLKSPNMFDADPA